MTGTHLSEEYELLRKWGFNEALFARAVSSQLSSLSVIDEDFYFF